MCNLGWWPMLLLNKHVQTLKRNKNKNLSSALDLTVTILSLKVRCKMIENIGPVIFCRSECKYVFQLTMWGKKAMKKK